MQARDGPRPAARHFLAISGGGDNGAYGAGFLNGWTASGPRPEFKAVTEISRGADRAIRLRRPEIHDHVLQAVYTSTAQKDIFKKRGLKSLLFGDAMADMTLAQVIESYVTRGVILRMKSPQNMPRGGSFSSAPPISILSNLSSGT